MRTLSNSEPLRGGLSDGRKRRKLRTAIIGVTGYGKHVLESFLPLVISDRIQFSGATIIQPDAAPETCALLRDMGCKIFTDYQDMLGRMSGEIDLCLIPTGIEFHRPMACEAMAHGAHVLVEKPLAGSAADAEEILAVSRRHHRRVAVGFQDLCSPAVLEVKRRILLGEAGSLRRIRAIGAWPRGFAYFHRNAWAGRLRREGRAIFDSPFNNAFGHLLNLAFFFAGAEFSRVAKPVHVDGRLYRTYPIESFDTGSIRVTTEQGILIDCYASHALDREVSPRLVVEGDLGSIEWEYEKTISLRGADGGIKWSLPLEKAPELRATAARVVVQAFESDEPLVNTAENALSHVLAIEKLHAAAVIRDVPKELVIEDSERLVIAGSAAWMLESFEKARPLE